jgi:hypothetical protein
MGKLNGMDNPSRVLRFTGKGFRFTEGYLKGKVVAGQAIRSHMLRLLLHR